MEKPSVIRIWITNKNNAQITAAMNQSMVDFLTVAIDHGCLGSTFAEDNERIIVYTKWSDEESLEKFRSSNEYKVEERNIHLLRQVLKFPAIYCSILQQKFCFRQISSLSELY